MSQAHSGRVTSIIYQTGDFRILKAILDDGRPGLPVTIRGNFPAQNVVLGSWLSFEGEWVEHPQYGKQLTVTRSPVGVTKWTDDRVLSALSANQVGPQLRLQLQLHAQTTDSSLADVLNDGLEDMDLEDLTKQYVVGRWRALRTHLEAAQFLSEAGVPAKIIGKIWSVLGGELEEKITRDPWILVRLGGISFKEADEVALRLGVDIDNQGRMNGAVLTAVQDAATEGHVFAGTGQVVASVGKMLSNAPTPTSVAHAIKELAASDMLVVTKEFGGVAVYEPWVNEMEHECAEILLQRKAHTASGIAEEKALHELDKWARGHKVTLTSTQQGAALEALTQPVSVLTGLPGTGKTTTLQAVVSILRDEGVPFLLAAPTGIAAKRLQTVTGAPASTVHRAFSAKGWSEGERESTYVGIVGAAEARKGTDTKSEQWGYDPDNPHPAQVVIVDESSMLDLHMLYRLLRGTSGDCRLVFVGDPYQLPSVGAGDVLRDLKDSGCFPHTHLNEIFRQEDTSSIVTAAHAIHAGDLPSMDDRDFLLLRTSASDNGDEAARVIRKIATRLFDKRENFQVLSPRHKGEAGVTNLNEILRMAINPPTPGRAERNLAGGVVREGDRIMVIKNDYEAGVYNGDVGKVHEINHRKKTLSIRVFAPPGQPEREITYDVTKGAPPIRLAYAQTIHKSQGQEYDIIVVPMLKTFGWQLQRNLLYTAITRAKKRVFIVGHESAVLKAVGNDRADQRNTNLAERLRQSDTTEGG